MAGWRQAPLSDDVISLREWRPDDAGEAFRDPDLGRFFGSALSTPRSDPDPEMPVWAIVREEDGLVVGRIWCRPHARPPEIGYYLRRDAWGRGYATRALHLGTEWLLGDGGFAEVELCTNPDNERSQQVALRAGYARIGTVSNYARFKDGTTTAVRFIRTAS